MVRILVYFLHTMKKRNLILSCILVLFAALSSFAQVNWVTIEEAEALQAKEKRKILIDVYTNWCGPCKMMTQNTFGNPKVAEYLNQHYYCVKFNAESEAPALFKGVTYSNPDFKPNTPGRNGVHQFARFLNVSAYPTLVFFDEDLNYLGPVVGYKTPSQLELFLTFFKDNKHKTVVDQAAWQAYQQAFVPSWSDQ